VHFQDAGVYGRIVHLQPVQWVDGWPLMGSVKGDGGGEPVLRHQKPLTLSRASVAAPQTGDEFDAPRLGFQWQWNANHRDAWFSLSARQGWLRLFPQPIAGEKLETQANLLLQKFPARAFTAETLLEGALQTGEEAGLAVVGKVSAELALEKTAAGPQLVLRIDGQARFSRELPSPTVKLRVAVQDGGVCRFSFASGTEWVEIPVDFQAQKGVWIGARVGLYAMSHGLAAPASHADFDWFRIT
jgi:beta-xylosidase